VTLRELIERHRVVISAGSGGVGKTTVAASIALWGASVGRRAVVITIDPARRLASSLGLETLGSEAREIPPAYLGRQGFGTLAGSLSAMMLDQKGAWDALVERHAPPEARDRILANPFYQHLSQAFAGSQEYMAIEQLCVLVDSNAYDLIVVDTPPTRNAIDFLEAPANMADFFSSRFLRLLTVPARSRFVNFATRPFYTIADRILGSQFLEDIAEFFLLFQTMYAGFVERARAVEHLLHDRRTTFMVVTTLEAAPLHEAEFFIDALHRQKFHLGALVLNRVLPSYLLDAGATRAAEKLLAEPEEMARTVGDDVGDRAQVARVLHSVGESFLNFQVVAKREQEERAELDSVPDVVVTVPYFETDIYDLGGLLRAGRAMWGEDATVS